MKVKVFSFIAASAGLLLAGCQTPLPPGAEPGPHGTMAYEVLVEASSPGVRIEADGQYIGEAPVTLKIFGDRDGTFHNFGSDVYVIRAYPNATNQFMQTEVFRTGGMLMHEDKIPGRVYLDMNRPPPVYMPVPYYVSPPPYYHGPSFYYYSGPRYYHRGGYHHRDHYRDHYRSPSRPDGHSGFKPPFAPPFKHPLRPF